MCKFLRNCLQKNFGSSNFCANIFANICANFWKKNICANICGKNCKKISANFLWILPRLRPRTYVCFCKSFQHSNIVLVFSSTLHIEYINYSKIYPTATLCLRPRSSVCVRVNSRRVSGSRILRWP